MGASLVLLLSVSVRADKIVLKNGRKILAYNVVDIGDRIQYETSAGQLTIPKSIVDHVEKGGLLPMAESPAAAAANLNLDPPAMESTMESAEIDKSAVHENGVDRDYLGRMEDAARSGDSQAVARAAIAHHAATEFELRQGNLTAAMADEKRALSYLPQEPALLLTVAYLNLKQSQFKDALEYVERAKRVAPQNADVYKLAGWAYTGMNRPDLAAVEWKKSLSIQPDPEVQVALDKALRDKEEEADYKENESAHFQLRYNGAAAPALARDVLRTLERDYSDISSELGYSPPEPIGVILYTQESFADITRAPGWAGALNDGRIRVPVQGLTSVDHELARVLRHELTHSFLQQKTHGRAPTWLQEGVAQWMEGRRSDENAAVLVQIYEQGQAAPLARLEGSWMGLSGDVARYSYAWSLANTEYLVQSEGMGGIEKILDRLAAGDSGEESVKEATRFNYGDLMQATAEFLKKNYVH